MVKTYSEDDTRVRDPIQIKEDYSNAIGQEFAPNMAERARVALTVDPYYFFVFHRNKVGRRCSCWDIETSPEGLCEVCWGSGVAGGYEKLGCKTEVLDVTYPNLRGVNIMPDFLSQRRPTPFTLLPMATKGYIEAEVPILQNTGILDYLALVSSAPNNSIVAASVRTFAESVFVPLTRANMRARLSSTRVVIRIDMSRASPDAPCPLVSHIMLRYQMKNTITINADIPKRTESILLADLGIMDNFAAITMVFDHTLSRIGTSDFLVLLDAGRRPAHRFKIIEVTQFKPFETEVGWEVQARFAHDYENYAYFPAETIQYIDELELDPISIDAPFVVTFTAVPSSSPSGSAVVLSWTTEGAVRVDIDRGVGIGLGANGSATVYPTQDTMYTLIAYSASGLTATRTVTVTVVAVSYSILQAWAWGTGTTGARIEEFAWADDSRILASVT